jgi:hypothetical protein
MHVYPVEILSWKRAKQNKTKTRIPGKMTAILEFFVHSLMLDE